MQAANDLSKPNKRVQLYYFVINCERGRWFASELLEILRSAELGKSKVIS